MFTYNVMYGISLQVKKHGTCTWGMNDILRNGGLYLPLMSLRPHLKSAFWRTIPRYHLFLEPIRHLHFEFLKCTWGMNDIEIDIVSSINVSSSSPQVSILKNHTQISFIFGANKTSTLWVPQVHLRHEWHRNRYCIFH